MYFLCSFFFLEFLFVILTKPKNKVKTQKPLCFANSSGYALWKNQIWINAEWRTLECWNFSLWFLTHDVLSFWKDAAMAAQHIFRFRKYSFFIFTLFVWRLQSSMVVTQTTNEIECFYYHQFNFTLFFYARVWIFVLQKHFFWHKKKPPHIFYCCEVENNNNKRSTDENNSWTTEIIQNCHHRSKLKSFSILNLNFEPKFRQKRRWTGKNYIQTN